MFLLVVLGFFVGWLFVFIVTRLQVGSSKQRGVGQVGSGRSFPSNQDSPSPGQVSLSSGVTCPGDIMLQRWHRAPGLCHSAGQGQAQALRKMKSGAAPGPSQPVPAP